MTTTLGAWPLERAARQRSVPFPDLVLFGIVVLSDFKLATVGIPPGITGPLDRLLFLAVWVAPLAVVVSSRSLPSLVTRRPLSWFLAWTVWSWLSIMWTVAPTATFELATARLTVFLFIVWYVDQHGWNRFVRVTAAGATLFLLGGFVAELLTGGSEDSSRLLGLVGSATGVGTYGAFACYIGFACWRQAGHRVLGLSCLAAGAVTLLWSNARGATAAAVFAIGLVLLHRHRRLLVPAALAAVILMAGVVLLESGGQSRLSRSGDVEELTTLTGRTDVWGLAVELIAERPIVGHGTGASYDVYGEATRQGRAWWPPHDSHNLLLTVWLESGLIGLGLFVAGTASTIHRLLRGLPAGIWPLGLLMIALQNGMTDSVILWPSMGLFALAAGATTASRY